MAKATKKATTAKSTSTADSFLEQENTVHALSYFPYGIGALAMFLLGKSDKKKLMHHVKYSALIAIAVFILLFVLNGFFARLISLVYLAGSAYLAWKAYNGEEVTIEILDTVEDKISEKVKK